MARTREFDPAAALDNAMKVFWRKGYYATSIEDLVEATGVSRYGLYSQFENKRGLFLAALDHYRSDVVQKLAAVLYQPDASLATIRQLVYTLAGIAGQPSGRTGCLLWNTASEVAPLDARAAEKTAAFRAFLTDGFRACLDNAAANGELPLGFDIEREADFLTGVIQTLSVMARSHAETRVIENFAAVSLSTLP